MSDFSEMMRKQQRDEAEREAVMQTFFNKDLVARQSHMRDIGRVSGIIAEILTRHSVGFDHVISSTDPSRPRVGYSWTIAERVSSDIDSGGLAGSYRSIAGVVLTPSAEIFGYNANLPSGNRSLSEHDPAPFRIEVFSGYTFAIEKLEPNYENPTPGVGGFMLFQIREGLGELATRKRIDPTVFE